MNEIIDIIGWAFVVAGAVAWLVLLPLLLIFAW